MRPVESYLQCKLTHGLLYIEVQHDQSHDLSGKVCLIILIASWAGMGRQCALSRWVPLVFDVEDLLILLSWATDTSLLYTKC